MGYRVSGRIRIRGLKVFKVEHSSGPGYLLIQGSMFGPNWPSIAWYLESFTLAPKLLEVDGFWLLINDSEANQEILLNLTSAQKTSRVQEVLVPGEGFVISEVPKKIDNRVFLAPVAALILTATIGFLPRQEISETTPETEPKINCALDLAPDEFNSWLSSSLLLQGQNQTKQQLIQTDLGLLTLEAEGSIGSATFFAALVDCQDGRSRTLSFRADSSALGKIIQLGQSDKN